jgi:hypothetical protein
LGYQKANDEEYILDGKSPVQCEFIVVASLQIGCQNSIVIKGEEEMKFIAVSQRGIRY